MATHLGVVVAELLAGGDAEHLADQVDAGDLLGHGVLDLEPGVDLEEGDGAVLGDEELAGAGADVAGLLEDRLGGLVEPLDLVLGEERRGRLLDELLVPALQRAVAGRDRPRRCRAGRRGTGSPRGAGLSRNFSTKHSPRPNAATASRTADSNASATSSISRATLRPRPPPPNAALIAIGRPCSSAKVDRLVGVGHRVLGARRQGCADLLGDVPGLDLVAQRRRSRKAVGRSRPGRRRSRPGRSRRSRRGSRSRGAPSRRRTSWRRRRSSRSRGRSRPASRRRGCTPRRRAARRARHGPGRRRPRRSRCRRPCRPG